VAVVLADQHVRLVGVVPIGHLALHGRPPRLGVGGIGELQQDPPWLRGDCRKSRIAMDAAVPLLSSER
jgi:hypothetical protein